jgi:hypothetical protein
LVVSICDVHEPDADEIAVVLGDNDRRAGGPLRQRQAAHSLAKDALSTYTRFRPLEPEAKKVTKQITDAEAVFQAMTVKHEEQTTPLHIRRNEINAIRKRTT